MSQTFTVGTYRRLVRQYRESEAESPALWELCIAGWLPAATDRLQTSVIHPLLGLRVTIGELVQTHADLMSEPLPDCAPSWLHPALPAVCLGV